ncbi:hypothetical protein [Pelagicoccus mobilis]|uniref:Uncharacterized protein n=1 Tax=Pelagicoccus mobilis TaxID=415221 RepID=A0A934VRS2_9BACT|nr:hypothetical protein [Pelagicoccus mobilis]MBK1878255.1 hypothetical protein [Pelagicoccus mobilis]
MRIFAFARAVVLFVSLSVSGSWAFADADSQYLGGAINTLDHFMQAGANGDASRGAMLLEAFKINERRAEYDTQRLYKKQKELLSSYVSVASDLYGYEVQKGFRGASVELEGGIETRKGVTAEFKARVVYRNKEWLIVNLEID